MRALTLLPLVVFAVGCHETPKETPKQRIPDVTVSVPVTITVPDFEYTGETQAVDMVTVRAKVGGTLKKILFTEGAEVKKGDALFEIEPDTYDLEVLKAKAELLRAEKEMTFQEKEMKRNEVLARDALSRSEYDKSVAALGISVAMVKLNQAKLQRAELDLSYCTVKAEISGTVGATLVKVGNLVSAGTDAATPLTTIVYLEKIYAVFYVDERSAQNYKKQHASLDPEKKKKIKVLMALNTDGGEFPYSGYIDYADSQADPNTGTFLVRAIFDNPNRTLFPGYTVRLRFYIEDSKPSLVISERALLADKGRDFVYVVNDKNVAEQKFVHIGRKIGGMVTIDDGVSKGDKIILYGLQRVRPGATVHAAEVPMPDIQAVVEKEKPAK